MLESRLLLSADSLRLHDFNGDGFSDVAEMKDNGEIWVGLSGADSFLAGSGLWADWADASNFVHIAFADVTADQIDDVIGMDTSGNIWVGESTKTGFVTSLWADWADASNFAHVVVGEFNLVTGADIAAMDTSGNWWLGKSNAQLRWGPGSVPISNGDAFESSGVPWFSWAPAAVWADIEVGSFRGLGSTEDIAGMDTSGNWWVTYTHVFAGGSGEIETQTSLWTTWAPPEAWADIVLGDFNNDDFDDLAGFDTSGNWWVALTGAGLPAATTLWADWADASAWADFFPINFYGGGNDTIVGIDKSGNVWLGQGQLAASLGSGLVQSQPIRSADADDRFPTDNDQDLAVFDVNGDWRIGFSRGGSIDARFEFSDTSWADWDPASMWATLDDALRREIELDRLSY